MTTTPADVRPAPVRLADCSPEQRRLVLLLIEAGRNHKPDGNASAGRESPDGGRGVLRSVPARRRSGTDAA